MALPLADGALEDDQVGNVAGNGDTFVMVFVHAKDTTVDNDLIYSAVSTDGCHNFPKYYNLGKRATTLNKRSQIPEPDGNSTLLGSNKRWTANCMTNLNNLFNLMLILVSQWTEGPAG